MNMKQLLKDILFLNPPNTYDFSLPDDSLNFGNSNTKNNNLASVNSIQDVKNIYPSIDVNLEYIKVKYNTLINSDVVIREFAITARNHQYKAFLLFIDGMVDTDLINNYILKPLMLKNSANSYDGNQSYVISEAITNNITVRKVKKFDIVNYISECLLPQNDIKKVSEFSDIFLGVNSGNCALFIDTLNIAFDIDVKGFKQRSIDTPSNEIVIKGPQEAFVENLRTNTSLIRRIVNNENLVIESIKVGKISRTDCAICYLSDIANSDLIAEIKYRINNLKVDSILSSRSIRAIN